MKIHEYQAKDIFSSYGIPVPKGKVANSPEEVRSIAQEIGGKVVIKAQVHVGGRGKAGGVKLASAPEEAFEYGKKILGMDIKGLVVKNVLVVKAEDIISEAYVGVIIDRKVSKPIIMVSPSGGVDIEEVARTTPEKIFKAYVEPSLGLLAGQARDLAFKLYDNPALAQKAATIIQKLYNVFIGVDATLAEINPLIVTPNNDLIAIDAKINLDDNALYRHPDLEELRDASSENPSENLAREKGLSFVKLDGSVGCIVNGAGLAMATMDLIKHYGGEPANFLDIGGSSSPEKVTTAMSIILKDPNVKSILFNIFGGITRCDDVAQGILEALSGMEIGVPIVVRLTGTNEDRAREILKKVELNVASSMVEGVQKAIELASQN